MASGAGGHLEPDVASNKTSSKRAMLRSLKQKTRAKTRKLLHQDQRHPLKHAQHEDVSAMEDIQHDPAFNPKRVSWNEDCINKEPKRLNRRSFRSAMHKVAHPVDAIKNTATKQTASVLADVQHPAISQQSDLGFLQSQCDLNLANKDRLPDAATQDYMETTAKLEQHRESMRVAWVTSRHVQRVRVVPKGLFGFPHSSEFKEYDEAGNVVKFHWINWVGNVSIPRIDAIFGCRCSFTGSWCSTTRKTLPLSMWMNSTSCHSIHIV